MIRLCAPICEKNFIHQIYNVHIITLSSLQVCIGNIHCMHGCMYVWIMDVYMLGITSFMWCPGPNVMIFQPTLICPHALEPRNPWCFLLVNRSSPTPQQACTWTWVEGWTPKYHSFYDPLAEMVSFRSFKINQFQPSIFHLYTTFSSTNCNSCKSLFTPTKGNCELHSKFSWGFCWSHLK